MSNVWTVHRIAEILELKLLCPPQFTSDGEARFEEYSIQWPWSIDEHPDCFTGSSRLYLGEYVLPIDLIAIQWL